MFTIPEQFSSATKSQINSQQAVIDAWASKGLESLEKIIQLNLSAAKANLAESNAALKELLSAKDPQTFFSISAAQAKPHAEKALAYTRHLTGIAADAHSELTKVAETQVAQNSSQAHNLIDEVSKNAPTGTEPAITAFKAAIDNANAAFAQLSKTARLSIETLEANLGNAGKQFAQAAEKATAKK